jgi:hypothetical protein
MKNYIVTGLLFFAVFSMFIFSSCEKTDDQTVIMNNAGSLTVKVVDENNQPCTNAHVRIYGYSSEVIFEDTTNTSGVFKIGKLLYGEYKYTISVKRGNISYGDSRMFQIVAGSDKLIEVKPFMNVSKVKLAIVNEFSGEVVPNINVGLSPTVQYQSIYSLEDFIKSSYFIKKTDFNGEVMFDGIPVGSIYPRNYRLFVFEDASNWEPVDYFLIVHPNKTMSYTVFVSL